MRNIIEKILKTRPVKAGSFIVTIYGDVVVPRGGTVWTGNLIDACRAAGISETHVRTAVSRLVARKRLIGERLGRRSFYRLADAAHAEFQTAAAMIYGAQAREQGEYWTFVAGQPVDEQASVALQRAGFGRIANGFVVAPGDRTTDVDKFFGRQALAFSAKLEQKSQGDLRAFAASHWPVDAQEAAYSAFVATFKPLLKAAARHRADEAEAFLLARLVLVDDYRHLVLADPQLPEQALPQPWAGGEARRLFAELYTVLTPYAEAYLEEHFIDASGPLARNTAETQARIYTLQKIIK